MDKQWTFSAPVLTVVSTIGKLGTYQILDSKLSRTREKSPKLPENRYGKFRIATELAFVWKKE